MADETQSLTEAFGGVDPLHKPEDTGDVTGVENETPTAGEMNVTPGEVPGNVTPAPDDPSELDIVEQGQERPSNVAPAPEHTDPELVTPQPVYTRDGGDVAVTAIAGAQWLRSPYVTAVDPERPLFYFAHDVLADPHPHGDGSGGIWHVYHGPVRVAETV